MVKYFHFHSDDRTFDAPLVSRQCTCIKANGMQCKNRVVIGLPFCHVHEKSVRHLVVKPSTIPNSGNGVFVVDTGIAANAVAFQTGAKITAYSGQVLTEPALIERYGEVNTAPYGIQLNHHLFEDAATHRGIGSLINHCPKKANVRFSLGAGNRVNVVAIKNIKNGSELFVNYGNAYRMHEEGVQSSTNNKKLTV